MTFLFAYLLIGLAAGFLAGLLGVGGGIVVVPLLAYAFTFAGYASTEIMHMAIATSLAAMVFSTGSAVISQARRGAVLWRIAMLFAPGLVLGAMFGAKLVANLPGDGLRMGFGIFEIVVAVQMFAKYRPGQRQRRPNAITASVAGVFIGFMSALLGIGGGTLVVPLLIWLGVATRDAVATSSACALAIACAGAATFLASGALQTSSPDQWGFIHLPALAAIVATSLLAAPAGVALVHKMPVRSLERTFALFLGALGIHMMFSAIA